MTRNGPVRAVVVENSAAQRRLVQVLQADGDIKVVGEASTATEAVSIVATTRPDVVAIDLHLEDGGGQYVVEQIMASVPTPILVLSTAGDDQARDPAIEALVGGALLALPKPLVWTVDDEMLVRKSVRSLHGAPVIRHPRGRLRPVGGQRASVVGRENPVVALAASTGGPPALALVLAGLGDLQAPVLVVQHLHPDFVAGLASWMARVSALPVTLAEHGQPCETGHVYLAPGETHLRLGARGRIELSATPNTIHRPSADELFFSVAERAGAGGVGVLLTGMGDDGARGLLAIHHRGGRTIAQDKDSSAVFGMPRAAEKLGAVSGLVPLSNIAAAVVRVVRELTA